MTRRKAKHAADAGLATCRIDLSGDDLECLRRATRITEWAPPGFEPFRIPVCRRHARRKRRDGWGVVRAYQPDLNALAAEVDRATWRGNPPR